ncbi:MAG: hypothetical protein FWE88_07295 [Phycisphaerae bacterium]|nr:hypothetical protein [Phycisphaerae bacterium]
MMTMKTIFHVGCLAVLVATLTGCGSGFTADGDVRILLYTWDAEDGDHAGHAARVKAIIERDKFKNLTIISKQNTTELYMGRYITIEAAEDDLKMAKAYKNTRWGDDRPFAFARTVLTPGKDVGPPEWNLMNVHTKYVYTVVVMTYHDQDKYVGRRQRAVEACRKLRSQGELAFFHHGASSSSVCVGLFKINGVRIRMAPAMASDTERGVPTIEKRYPSAEVQAVLKKYPAILANDRQMIITVPTAKKPNMDVSSVTLTGDADRLGSFEEFHAPSYVIEIPRRPSANDPFAGIGDS